MLIPAPYEVPVKKAKKKATGTRKGLRCKVISDSSSDNSDAPSSHENEEEEEESSPPSRGGQEKEGRPNRGGGRVQEGKDPSFRTAPRRPPTAAASGYPGRIPWRSRKYPDTIVIHGMFYCTASPHAEHDYAVRPELISTYLRRAVRWTRRI